MLYTLQKPQLKPVVTKFDPVKGTRTDLVMAK